MAASGPKLSVVVIAKDEADRMPRLLKSVFFADEVLVVDSGSSDRTTEICRQMGARVIFHEWAGFAAQKQFALEQASGEWILSLDADEEIRADLAEEIKHSLADVREDTDAFSIPRLSRYLGRWIKHGGWYPDRQVRLARRSKARWQGGPIHERLEVPGRIQPLTHPILHYVYRDIADQLGTINQYSDLFAAERGRRNNAYVLAGAAHAIGKFFECFLWKLGILDGIPGLIIAMNSAWYIFLKHAKCWEQGLPPDDG
jgi:glycosyltransferase involved in cell wall biosynthesis